MRQQFDAVVAQLTGGGGSPSAGPTQEVADAIATAAPTLQVHVYPTAVGKPASERMKHDRKTLMSPVKVTVVHGLCRPC